MSDDLVSRLKSCAKDCERLGDEVDAAFFNEAATALTESRAEIERLREWKQNQLVHWPMEIERRNQELAAAESELSTLRARVREVVGGMLAHSCVADAGQDCKDEEDEAAERAARQLMEDLK